ncbi:MAG: helix-turn-helix domain-containing protein [Burkholderiaceae bacterium]|jgi:DNA-binding transcriptional regulator YiaG|nr:helix-turn-helix domain-containing protein [Burkholderiaceae bacterium]
MAYHYTESGLRNVWLENGYTVRQTPYGETIAIEAIEELHQVIGRALAHKAHLTGAELRFLRKQLGLSQAALAHLVGGSEQTVSLWERRGKIPKASDRLIRAVYLEQIDGNVKIQNLLTELQDIDRSRQERIDLRFSDGDHWRQAA